MIADIDVIARDMIAIVEQENGALSDGRLADIAAQLPRKRAVATALQDAVAQGRRDGLLPAALKPTFERLDAAVRENEVLLTRALEAQQTIVKLLLDHARPADRQTRYADTGAYSAELSGVDDVRRWSSTTV